MNTILVIDDNYMIRNSVSLYLGTQLQDCTIITAEDGEQGIEFLNGHSVSLVLTDLEMPRMDGYQVIDYVKKNYPEISIIVMTGLWSDELCTLVNRAGVVHCVAKPCSLKELAWIVSETLGQQKEKQLNGAV